MHGIRSIDLEGIQSTIKVSDIECAKLLDPQNLNAKTGSCDVSWGGCLL